MKIRIRLLALIVLTLTTLNNSTQVHADKPTLHASVQGVTEYRLDNGLRVLLMPDSSTTNLTMNMTVMAGSRAQLRDEIGIAHLVEHMMLQGTPTRPNIPEMLEERGATYNAQTWADAASYFETMPASRENLEFAIALEADRLVNSTILQSDLDTEITVVMNEMEVSHDSPVKQLRRELYHTAFRRHMYGTPILGNRSDINAFTSQKLRRFYERLYRPDNTLLIVTGKFDADAALQFAETYFGAIPKPDTPLLVPHVVEVPQSGQRSVQVSNEGGAPMMFLGYRVPSAMHRDMPIAEVFCQILQEELNNRMKDSGKSTGAGVAVNSAFDSGLATIGVDVNTESDLPEIQALVENTVASVEEWIDQKDVDRAKAAFAAFYEAAVLDTNSFASTLSSWSSLGDWRIGFIDQQLTVDVTLEQVLNVAQTYFQPINCTVATYRPVQNPMVVEIPPAPKMEILLASHVARKPAVETDMPAFEITFESIEQRSITKQLPSGVLVRMLPKPARGNVVSIFATIKYGNLENLDDYLAAANLLPSMMLQGTSDFSRDELVAELNKIRAGAMTGGGLGTVNVQFVAKREQLQEALNLLRQILREPSFPKREFETLRQEMLTGTQSQMKDPASLAIEYLQAATDSVEAGDIRRARSLQDRMEMIRSLSLDRVRELHQRFLGAENTTLSIVGDFSPTETLSMLESVFDGWDAAEEFERIPEVASRQVPLRHTIRVPGMENASYIACLPLEMSIDHPDAIALLIANKIFGGSPLHSRLANLIRQQEGLAYHIGSEFAFETLDDSGLLLLTAISAPENVGKVGEMISGEIDRLVSEGISEAELAEAKTATLEEIRAALGSGDLTIASVLTDWGVTGRNSKRVTDRLSQIESLTVQTVSDTIRRHIEPKQLSIVTAGDLAETEDSVVQLANKSRSISNRTAPLSSLRLDSPEGE